MFQIKVKLVFQKLPFMNLECKLVAVQPRGDYHLPEKSGWDNRMHSVKKLPFYVTNWIERILLFTQYQLKSPLVEFPSTFL